MQVAIFAFLFSTKSYPTGDNHIRTKALNMVARGELVPERDWLNGTETISAYPVETRAI